VRISLRAALMATGDTTPKAVKRVVDPSAVLTNQSILDKSFDSHVQIIRLDRIVFIQLI